VLLDEPLANLDYKLREELRDELPKLFAGRNAIVVYATTEPHEALLFGGETATLYKGRVTQFGKTAEIYRHPADLVSARVFSDPPINTAKVVKRGGDLMFADTVRWAAGRLAAAVPDGEYTIGVRPHHVTPEPRPGSEAIEGRVLVAELSGSESVVHFDMKGTTWVSQSAGIHAMPLGSSARMHVDLSQAFLFGSDGRLIEARV
jgi:glycerol transport system ATP-binding protein